MTGKYFGRDEFLLVAEQLHILSVRDVPNPAQPSSFPCPHSSTILQPSMRYVPIPAKTRSCPYPHQFKPKKPIEIKQSYPHSWYYVHSCAFIQRHILDKF